MIRGHAPAHTADTGSIPDGRVARNQTDHEPGPKARNLDLVTGELRSVRDQLDRHLQNGNLSLAAECSFDLEQLRIEFAVLSRST
jgi:hypothetical protein